MLKTIVAHFIVLFLLIQVSYAQHNGACNTRLSDAQENWLKAWVQQNAANYRNVKSGTIYMPIKAHIVGRDNGTGYYSLATLLQVICELNTRYQPVGFYFYLDPTIDYINNSLFYEDGSSQDAYTSMGTNNVADEINMYFVQASPGLCGYYAPWLDCVCIIGSCGQPGGTTITHELGHFFSLPHTFNGWEGGNIPGPGQLELVNGSNCSTSGDYFCDTPADYLSDRWNCPYIGSKTDPNGTPYNPDPTFYMSYASDVCTNRFSNLQIGAMQANANTRVTLINQGTPNLSSVTQVPTNCTPSNFDFNLNPSFTKLHWSKPLNADYSLLQIASFGGGAILKEVITIDSIFNLTGLTANTPFQWRVRGFNAGNTCNNTTLFSSWNTFSTGDFSTSTTSIDQTSAIYAFQNEGGSWIVANYLKQPVTLRVYDVLGKLLFEKSLEKGVNSMVELEALPSSSYVGLISFNNANQGHIYFIK